MMAKRSNATTAPASGRSLAERLIIFCAILGCLLTAYLWYHTATEAPLAYCSAGSDCDLVQSSRWSRFLGLPMAAWGLMTYVIILAWSLFVRGARTRPRGIVLFATVGFAVSLYLTVVSIFSIKATCPYCLASLFFMSAIYAASWRLGAVATLANTHVTAVVLAILLVGGLWFYFARHPDAGVGDPRLVALARHLSAREARFYGASWCPHCQDQKAMFGAAAAALPYLECSPDGPRAPQSTACLSAEITRYPTWIINGRRHERVLSFEQLAKLSGYRGDLPSAPAATGPE